MSTNFMAGADGRIEQPLVILSTADFHASIWTNKQHLATRLSASIPVIYIESLGLRAPKIRLHDIKRILRRLKVKFARRRELELSEPKYENLKIISPIVIPWHKYRLVRWINQILLDLQVARKLPKGYVLWSFSPIIYGLGRRASKKYYHSVDLLHAIDGLPSKALVDAERGLVGKLDGCIASSLGVKAHLENIGFEPILWENVADVELFAAAKSSERVRRAIFAGNVTTSKVDISILMEIAERDCSVAIVGPVGIDGSSDEGSINELLDHKNVEYLGVLSQEAMAQELGRSWVGIIPYKDNSYTHGVFPMKVYEYLAAGLSVVSTPIASLRERRVPGVALASPEQFPEAVAKLLSEDRVESPETYDQNSWSSRVRQIRSLISS